MTSTPWQSKAGSRCCRCHALKQALQYKCDSEPNMTLISNSVHVRTQDRGDQHDFVNLQAYSSAAQTSKQVGCAISCRTQISGHRNHMQHHVLCHLRLNPELQPAGLLYIWPFSRTRDHRAVVSRRDFRISSWQMPFMWQNDTK